MKRLAGNPGKRAPKAEPVAVAPVEPEAPADAFAPPPDLTAAERVVWSAELPRLRTLGLLKPSDLSAFRIYCEAMVRKTKAKAVVDEKGLTYETETGYVRERPEVKILERAERVIQSFMKELAMTSKSRVQTAATLANRQLPLPGFGAGDAPPAPSPAPAAKPTVKHGGPIGILRH